MRNWAIVILLVSASAAAQTNGVSFNARVSVDHGGGKPDHSGVVLWLIPDAATVPSPAPGHFRLLQKNKQFEPHLLVIPVGSTVDFPNQDPFFHNVFSLYKGKRFDLGLYEAGSSRSVHFDRPGVSFIFCNIHPQMMAVVITMTTPYYAVSNAAGDLSVHNLPPGRYQMELWYERASTEALHALSREITLPMDSAPTFHLADAVQGPIQHKNKYGKDYDQAPTYGQP